MGDIKGFIKSRRKTSEYRPVCERVKDYREVSVPRTDADSIVQASRCMDCGTPFCHFGCPIGNYIPEWNDLVFDGKWKRAYELLSRTNNLPEITGRVCPATCEYACVLGINDDPVTIRDNELAIIEHAFKERWVTPGSSKCRTGKRVAVIGSGPAGIACADQLNRAGHQITVFERDGEPGGIMRYGIPDFKLEKYILDRRLDVLKASGVDFKTGVNVGVDLSAAKLLKDFDAVCLAGGSREPRDIKIEGRELKGIHFAMDYLIQQNRINAKEKIAASDRIDANAKRVVVIGGGDTGADCVGTAARQGAKCIVQLEVLPKPPECRDSSCPWPGYPLLLKTTSSHEEGVERKWSVQTRRFIGRDGAVKKLQCVEVEMPGFKEVKGSEFEIDADLVILAVGFVHPEHDGLLKELGVEFDQRGNVKTGENYMSTVSKVFSAGDMRRGQSLIVHAISEGRRAAHNIDKFLMGESRLALL